MTNVYSGDDYNAATDDVDLDNWEGTEVSPVTDGEANEGEQTIDDGLDWVVGDTDDGNTAEMSVGEPGAQPEEDGGQNIERKASSEAGAGGSSANVFSSLASALTEEGVFAFLQDPDAVNDADSFRAAMEHEINSRLSARQQRVEAALGVGAPADDIQSLEDIIDDLGRYSDDMLEDESDAGLATRKRIIYTAAKFRGLTDDKANKEVNKSIKAGSDIEDAKENLASMKQDVSRMYQNLIQQGEARQRKYQEDLTNWHKKVVSDIGNSDGFLGSLTPQMKRMVYETAFAPTERLANGAQVTPVGKFASEHPDIFNRIVGELYVRSNGFRDMMNVANQAARKEVSRGLANLEKNLRTSQGASIGGGNLQYASSEPDGLYNDRFVLEV